MSQFPKLRAEKTKTIVFADSPMNIFCTLNREGYNEELVERFKLQSLTGQWEQADEDLLNKANTLNK
jgi:hypothetical protein